VETPSQLHALARLGCDRVQGFLMSRPLPAAEVAELLAFPLPFSGLVPGAAEAPAEVDQEVMAAVARAVAAGEDAGAVARPLLAELAALTGLESAYLTRIDFEQGVQTVVAAHNGGRLRIEEGASVPWADTLCRRALATGARHTADAGADFPDCAIAAQLGLHTYVMVPVVAPGGGLVGTLCTASTAVDAAGPETVRLLELFSRLIGEAVEGDRPSGRAVRVVVADDSPVVRTLLRQVLEADGAIEIVAEAANGREAVEACRSTRPDVILLDLDMPEVDGVTAIPLLAEASPETKVVVLSGDDGRRAREIAAAAAVIDKRTDPARLRSVVAAVA
jgi:CheY-like chemotaxis protein